MGLLMTPRLGPRVRVAVVTTDMPLVPDGRRTDAAMLDFCRICKKCAEACPGKAIPFDDRREIDGAFRWRIDSEACFAYWCAAGTDCARCMKVCPYSHPNAPLHNAVRRVIRRSAVARRIALHADDLFYGRRPTDPGNPPPFPSPAAMMYPPFPALMWYVKPWSSLCWRIIF